MKRFYIILELNNGEELNFYMEAENANEVYKEVLTKYEDEGLSKILVYRV